MKNSFGVFQEPPFDVVWKFAPEVSDDVRTWMFHPNQTTETLEDGSIVVRFRAGGRQEMEWFLHTWGEWVEDLTNYSI